MKEHPLPSLTDSPFGLWEKGLGLGSRGSATPAQLSEAMPPSGLASEQSGFLAKIPLWAGLPAKFGTSALVSFLTWFFLISCWTLCRLLPRSFSIASGRRSCTQT